MIPISYIGLLALVFAQFLTTAVPAYLLLVLGLSMGAGPRLPLRLVLYIGAIVCYWLTVFSFDTGKNIFTHMLFYFGFLIPLTLFFVNKRLSIELIVNERAIVALCILVIVEAALLNSPIGPSLYFFPEEGTVEGAQLLGFYQRPMGIGGNPSMTSIVLYFLLVLTEQIRGTVRPVTRTLVYVTTVILASGTAFGLFLLYVLVSGLRLRKLSPRYFLRSSLYLLVLLLGLATIYGYFGMVEDFDKYSIDYITFLYDLKVESTESMVEAAGLWDALFGRQIYGILATSGDAGFLVTPEAIGIIGAGLLFFSPLLYPNGLRRNIVPTIFFMASFIHYPGLLSPPGQLLFAAYLYLLAYGERGLRQQHPATTRAAEPQGNPKGSVSPSGPAVTARA